MQHSAHERVDVWGGVAAQLAQARRCGRHEASQGRDHGWPDVRRAPGDQLEQGGAERVDVAARVDRRVTACLLGCHVGGRAHHVTRTGDADVTLRGHAEVHQLHPPRTQEALIFRRLAQKEIARLDVAVNDAGRVRGLQRFGDLDGQLDGLRNGERLALLTRGQIFTFQPFHGHEGQAAFVEYAEADRLDDAGVVQVLEQLAFSGEARFFFRSIARLRGDHFQSHDLLAVHVVGAIHDAGAAAPDLALDDEAVAQFSAFGDGP